MRWLYAECINVKLIPSKGVTRIEIEVPEEFHVSVTQALCRRQVVVMPAPDDKSPYGWRDAGRDESGGEREPESPVAQLGPLAKSAVLICQDTRFQAFAIEMCDTQPPASGEAAAKAYILHECCIGSRKELDTNEAAGDTFRGMMSVYREWLADLPATTPAVTA